MFRLFIRTLLLLLWLYSSCIYSIDIIFPGKKVDFDRCFSKNDFVAIFAKTLLSYKKKYKIKNEIISSEPQSTLLYKYCRRLQFENATLIIAEVYLERYFNSCKSIELESMTEVRFRQIVFLSLLLASKVHDDLSCRNSDFYIIQSREYAFFDSLSQLNREEKNFLQVIKWDVSYLPKIYSQNFQPILNQVLYIFRLRQIFKKYLY